MFPAYVLGGNTVTVYPSTIRQAGDVQAQYVRYPKPPQWTYLTLSKGEPTFDSSSNTFQDFELPLSDEPGIIAKICQYAGVEIREADVYNFGKTEQDSDQQIQV